MTKIILEDTNEDTLVALLRQGGGGVRLWVTVNNEEWHILTLRPDGIERAINVPDDIGLPVDSEGRVDIMGESPSYDEMVRLELAECLAKAEKALGK